MSNLRNFAMCGANRAILVPAPNGFGPALATATGIGARTATSELHPSVETVGIARMQRFVLVANCPFPIVGAAQRREHELTPQAQHDAAEIGTRRAKPRQFKRIRPTQARARLTDQRRRNRHGDEFAMLEKSVPVIATVRAIARSHTMLPSAQGRVYGRQFNGFNVSDWSDQHDTFHTGLRLNLYHGSCQSYSHFKVLP